MPDRSGAREPKGASLKKSKKNPGAPTGRTKRQPKQDSEISIISAPPPSLGEGIFFDCGSALLSRQFDRDREKVLSRARTDGLCAILGWFSDVEKLETLLDLCKGFAGFCYVLSGVHPDNIERTNKKSHDGWLAKVEEVARSPICVGILSGLNLGREIGTHFAQESLLRSACSIAEKLLLPLVLHVANAVSLDRVIEILREERWIPSKSDNGIGDELIDENKRVVLHDAVTACSGDNTKISTAVDCGFHFIVSGLGITDTDSVSRGNASECVRRIPLGRLLCASDSPWRTPQNLPDPYLCTLRNEPSNLPAIVTALASIYSIPDSDMAHVLKTNALSVFGLTSVPVYQYGSGTRASSEFEEKSDQQVVPCATKAVVTEIQLITPEEHEGALPGVICQLDERGVGSDPRVLIENTVENEDSETAADPPSYPAPPLLQSSAATGQYGCVKCRRLLFRKEHVITHSMDAIRTVFKVGEEGLCTAAVFVPLPGTQTPHLDLGFSVVGTNVECIECGSKLGRYSAQDSACPCGAVVPGPVARVMASKVDYFDGTVDTVALNARARIEAEEAQELLVLEDLELEQRGQGRKTKKKKKIKSDNRGNFSYFRNKTFVPNASRSANKGGAVGKKEGGGEEGEGNASDPDDEEEQGMDDNEEDEN